MYCMGVSEANQQGNPVIPGRWHGLIITLDALLSTFEWWPIGMTLSAE